MRKHYTKDELLRQLKQTANVVKKASSAPFTGMAILANYTLWKTERWGQTRLAEYNKRVAEYYAGEIDEKALSDRLMEKADFTVQSVQHTAGDNCQKKTRQYRWFMEQKLIDAEDEINRSSAQYFLICFNALMDMGYGNKRLNRVKDAINEKLKENEKEDAMALRMRQELIDNLGILIEMPN